MFSRMLLRPLVVSAGAALAFVLAAAGPVLGPDEAEAKRQAYSACGSSQARLVGFSDALNKTSFGGFSVTELSGLAYDSNNDAFYAVADRAGAVQSHVFEIDIPAASIQTSMPSVIGVTVLEDATGTPFNGFNLDGEGIVFSKKDGNLIVASESGSAAGQQPEVRVFGLDGTHLQELAIPAKFLIGANNLSFESLAISPNGRSIFTAVEGPLAADGRTADLRSRIRILRFEANDAGDFEAAEEYFYLTEPGRNATELGVAEMVAVSENHLLVLERGFVAGQGNTIRIFSVNLHDAEDVSSAPSLADPALTPLEKTLVVDLATCPDEGATVPPGATQPNALLDNFEAMALGPELGSGYRSLVLMSDDNSGNNQTTRIVVLALPDDL